MLQIIQKRKKITMEGSPPEALKQDFPTKPKPGRRKGLQGERERVCKGMLNRSSNQTLRVRPMNTAYSDLITVVLLKAMNVFKKN